VEELSVQAYELGTGTVRPVSFIVILIAVFFTVPSYLESIRSGPTKLTPERYAASATWLESAECARTTGIPLIGCRDNKRVSFVEISQADDPGHALFLGIYAMASGKHLVPQHIHVLNTTVNYAGVLMLAGLLLSLELRFASALLLVLGALTANQFYMMAPYPAQLGGACFAAILPIVILTFLTRPRITNAAVAWTVIGLIALSIASLLRQPIGMMGAVATFASIGLNLFRTMSTKRRAILYPVIVAGAIAGTFATPILLRVWDVAFNLPPAQGLGRHGAFHSMYIGLGVVDNPFGIAWEDRFGFEAAQKAVPGTMPNTAAYHSVISGLYFDIVRNNPLAVLRIYGEKFWITLTQRGPAVSVFPGQSVGAVPAVSVFPGQSVGGVLAFAVIVGGYLRWRLWQQKSKKNSTLSEIDAVGTVAVMFVTFFLAQGSIINYAWVYLFPVQAFLIVILGLVLQYWIVLEQTMRAHRRGG
jgi:hypothetical protein